MNLKDSFKGRFDKDFLNRYKSELLTHTTKLTKQIKTKIIDFRIEKLSKLNKNEKIGIGIGILGIAVIGTVILMNSGTDVYKLTIAGQDAGYLSETKMVAQTLDEIKTDLSKNSDGLEITVNDSALSCKKTDLNAKEVNLLTAKELKKEILAADLCKAKAWAINVNGNNIVAAATEKEAKSILTSVISHYKTDGSQIVSSGFKEAVAVTKAAVSVADIMKPADAVNLIITGTKEPKTYTVQDGDTIWDIATANGMSPNELQVANPGFDPSKLKIGQQLNLYQTKPYVTVQIKEVVASTETIDYKTVYEPTTSLYKGEVKVKTPGVFGTKEIRTEVTQENGVTVASNELGTVVTAEPQSQITLKGTRSLATFVGTGSLSSPVSHIEVSSAFGANRGSSRHTGVDLRNPKGTPIRAADGGVVTFAAYSGSLGNVVKISHGNGLETWYAHCNSMNVSAGEKVSKGEVIAAVGMTGRATGYHLHFEVRKNGVPQNPMNYL
jgi:Membrane proteins related to metalloendopeptidases